jgi:hypothetical protein
MSTQIQRRRGTTVQHSSFTGAAGETTIDTDKEVVVVHDGVQVGGYPLMRENGSNSALALGSAGTPSLKFTGDTNTGIYSPGADQVAISTNGQGRLFVDASGNVGAGTSSPTFSAGGGVQAKYATFSAFRATVGANTGTDFAASSDGTGYVYVRDNAGLIFGTSNTERMRLDSSGRLGLGNSSPSSYNASASDLVVGNHTGAHGVTICSQNNSSGYIMFADGTTGAQTYAGQITYDHTNNRLTLGTNDGTTGLTVDSSQRVGIGNNAPDNTLSLGAVGSIDQDANSVYIGNNFTSTGANFKKTGNYAQQLMFDTATGSLIYKASASTGTAGNAITFSERFRCDSAGRLLVGTSTSVPVLSSATGAAVQVNSTAFGSYAQTWFYGANNEYAPVIMLAKSRNTTYGSYTVVQNNDQLGGLWFAGDDGTDLNQAGAKIEAFVDGTPGNNDMPGRLVFSTTPDGLSSPQERMRIRNNGQVWINQTANMAGTSDSVTLQAKASGSDFVAALDHSNAAGGYGLYIRYTGGSPNNTSNEFLYCQDTGAVRASIRSNGGLANYSANNVNLSDINSKKDITPAAGTWDCLKEWEIVNFRYKDQPDNADLNMGVIAQQVAESCPEVITVFQEATEDQPEKLGVKDQQMMWMAIKALQEAQVRIEQLEASNAEMEGRLAALEGA